MALVPTRFRTVTMLCAVLACGEREHPAGSPPSADSATPALATAADTGAGCPAWGLWQRCSVEERLSRAGLVIERDSATVRHEFLRVPGIRYQTFRAEIEVFLYASAEARARDTDELDSATVSPRGRTIVWRAPPTLVTSGNLAAIILSLNERQAERIALALGAGLPAGPSR